MGILARLGAPLTRLDQAFLQDNPQAFRFALAELQSAFSEMRLRDATSICDAYEQVEAFAKDKVE